MSSQQRPWQGFWRGEGSCARGQAVTSFVPNQGGVRRVCANSGLVSHVLPSVRPLSAVCQQFTHGSNPNPGARAPTVRAFYAFKCSFLHHARRVHIPPPRPHAAAYICRLRLTAGCVASRPPTSRCEEARGSVERSSDALTRNDNARVACGGGW